MPSLTTIPSPISSLHSGIAEERRRQWCVQTGVTANASTPAGPGMLLTPYFDVTRTLLGLASAVAVGVGRHVVLAGPALPGRTCDLPATPLLTGLLQLTSNPQHAPAPAWTLSGPSQ